MNRSITRAFPFMLAEGLTPEEMKQVMAEAERQEETQMVLESILDGRKARAEKLAQEQGISLQTAYKKLQGEKFKAPIAEGASRREAILEILYRLNASGGVSLDTLASGLKNVGVKMDRNDLVGRMWDLQKLAFIKFNETHTSRGSELRRIRLTVEGRAKAIELRGGTPRQAEERVNARSVTTRGFSQSPRMGDHKPVGVDGTDFRNHRKRAQGGPITRIPGKAKPEVVAATSHEVPKPKVVEPPRQNERLVEPEKPVAPVMYVLDLKDYPYIAELLDRRVEKNNQREKAAKVVEAASIMADVDVLESEHLLELAAELEGKPLTHLETDVLKLVDQLINHAGDVKE